MPDDQLFRWVLLGGFLIVFPVAFRYRLKAHSTGEQLDRRQEGWFVLATLRPIALARMAGVTAFVVSPSWMTWSAVPLPIYARWTGVVIGGLAATLLVWVFKTLGPNLTDTVVTRKQAQLVTDGPYRFVRHPLYSATALAVIADSMVVANWFLAVTGLLVVGLLALRTYREEANLLKHFGEDYEKYAARTPRYVPAVRGRAR